MNYEPLKSICLCEFEAILRTIHFSTWYAYTTERENTVLENSHLWGLLFRSLRLGWLRAAERVVEPKSSCNMKESVIPGALLPLERDSIKEGISLKGLWDKNRAKD